MGNHNLLDKFYHDKERYAYTFQNYIFFTRMMQASPAARRHSGGCALCFSLYYRMRDLLYFALAGKVRAAAFGMQGAEAAAAGVCRSRKVPRR